MSGDGSWRDDAWYLAGAGLGELATTGQEGGLRGRRRAEVPAIGHLEAANTKRPPGRAARHGVETARKAVRRSISGRRSGYVVPREGGDQKVRTNETRTVPPPPDDHKAGPAAATPGDALASRAAARLHGQAPALPSGLLASPCHGPPCRA